MPTKLTEQNVKEVLLDASMQKAVFLYFYIPGPECEEITKALRSQIGDNNEYISLVEADVQEAIGQGIAMQLGLRGVPALVVFQEGSPADALQGAEILTQLKEIMGKYMPSEVDIKIKQALEAEASGDPATALTKAREAYNLDPNNLKAKHLLARLLIAAKNLDTAEELLKDPGREEASSQEYQDLISALNLARKAQESPEIRELEKKHLDNPDDEEISLALAAALSEAGRKEAALELLYEILKKDLGREKVKKTFLDIIATMSGDPLQGKYRRRLYTLMY